MNYRARKRHSTLADDHADEVAEMLADKYADEAVKHAMNGVYEALLEDDEVRTLVSLITEARDLRDGDRENVDVGLATAEAVESLQEALDLRVETVTGDVLHDVLDWQ